jgi:hypothetical protein
MQQKVGDSDPNLDLIRIQLGLWILIQEGDPEKRNSKEISCSEMLDGLVGGPDAAACNI